MKGKFICLVVAFTLAAAPVFSQNDNDFGSLLDAVEIFSDSLAKSLPVNSTIGLNWSDAYIGQLPSNFGLGVTAGFTTIDIDAVKDLMGMFGLGVPLNNLPILENSAFPIPAYTIEARIGGIKVPLDIGFKFGYLQPESSQALMDKFSQSAGFGFKYMLIGGDFRYALLNKKVFPVRLSIGFSFNYLDGGIISNSGDISFVDQERGIGISSDSSEIELKWNTLNLEFKTQISFPLKLITPYAGLGVGYALSNVGYRFSTPQLTTSGGSLDYVKEVLGDEFKIKNVSETGFESSSTYYNFNARAFGGLSFNVVVFRLDFTGIYSFVDSKFGASFGFRFQL